MAVGTQRWPNMLPISGMALGVADAGIKDNQRNDLLLLQLAPGTNTVGVFTKNDFCAAPVSIAKEHLKISRPEYLLVNSGNANACTGEAGHRAAMQCCEHIAVARKCMNSAVLPFSTGVIGELLPAEKIIKALPHAQENLDEDNWLAAAEAIMTTDTCPKGASTEIILDGIPCKITGIAKGAGMIKPNMGTMLAYIASDCCIEKALLQGLCTKAANASFNRITIDGDTSTNDACMLMTTGRAGNPLITSQESEAYKTFECALLEIFQSLAQQIVRDGEGATKFVEVEIKAGKTHQESLQVAYEIAHSPLVKTALFASDPNWGRIVAAIGNAGLENLDSARVKVWINELPIVENGARAPSYSEEAGQAEMHKAELRISVDLGRGNCSEKIWTTDLSHEYIKINAEYRT